MGQILLLTFHFEVKSREPEAFAFTPPSHLIVSLLLSLRLVFCTLLHFTFLWTSVPTTTGWWT